MCAQKNQEIKECLAELSAIVDLYNPKKNYFMAIVFLSAIVICLIVIFEIGLIWGIILLGLVIVPLGCYFADAQRSNKCMPNEKELAERACILMSSCIDRYKYPEKEIYYLCYNLYDNNIPLYKEFSSLFPQMASKKLKKLASIKIRD